jgi:hypothetical protein
MKNKWKDIEVGDFFTVNLKLDSNSLIYQKVDEVKCCGYNAFLLNTGQLCFLYINSEDFDQFKKIELNIEIKDYE